MKVLVLGASGLIGRRVVPLLLARGYSVTAAARSPGGLARLASLGAVTTPLDILDRDAVRRAVDGQSVVVNLVTRVPGSGLGAFLPGAWKAMDRVRRDGSAIVADAAIDAGVRRVIQESFALTYPDAGATWIDETVRTSPAAYNRTALDAEASVQRVARAGAVGVALRFALLYGGADDPFTREFIRYARRGWFPLLGRADGYVSMVMHDDAATAVVAAMDAASGVYNVVDDQPLTRRELAAEMGRLLGVAMPKLAPAWVAALGGSVGKTIARSLRISNRSLRATGWRPRYPSGREGWQAAVEAIAAAPPLSA